MMRRIAAIKVKGETVKPFTRLGLAAAFLEFGAVQGPVTDDEIRRAEIVCVTLWKRDEERRARTGCPRDGNGPRLHRAFPAFWAGGRVAQAGSGASNATEGKGENREGAAGWLPRLPQAKPRQESQACRGLREERGSPRLPLKPENRKWTVPPITRKISDTLPNLLPLQTLAGYDGCVIG